jgi:hypothetical protein
MRCLSSEITSPALSFQQAINCSCHDGTAKMSHKPRLPAYILKVFPGARNSKKKACKKSYYLFASTHCSKLHLVAQSYGHNITPFSINGKHYSSRHGSPLTHPLTAPQIVLPKLAERLNRSGRASIIKRTDIGY